MPATICCLNEAFVPLDRAVIPISDIGLHRDHSVFDYFRTYQGRALFLEDHLERLYASAEGARLTIPYAKSKMAELVAELMSRNQYPDSGIKILVTGGNSDDYSSPGPRPNVLIIQQKFNPWPGQMYLDGVGLISQRYVRQHPLLKTTNYFVAMREHQRMKAADCVEILFHQEWITEASRSNVFFVKDQKLFTPKSNILHGITRKKVIELFDVSIRDISFDDLYTFDEMFITSTVKEILPVIRVDGVLIGNGRVGPVAKQVASAFKTLLS